MIELLPTKASFAPGEAISIEVRGAARGTVRVFHLGELLVEAPHAAGDIVLPPLPPGGYSIELGDLHTAVEVTENVRDRLRYGFVASYAPDKDIAGVIDTVRRLHLNGMQFYDWAYRHADLMGGGETYRDALDQPISLATVRALARAVQGAGSRALGYAAVYAVGPNEWPLWQHDALLKPSGEPCALGNFLFVLDPAAPDWLAHFAIDLQRASAIGFDGFHLDQYGWPKRAIRADGVSVDVAHSFVTLIDVVRAALPKAHLVFNNVNDFPTRLTAQCAQDALYIEPWAPQVTLQSLADTATRARLYGGGKPVVLAAYQHVYETAPPEATDRATRFTMAALFSHGATQLLAGEADRLLSDPYYVRNHVATVETLSMLKRWYDFLVAHDELLMPPALTEVTHSYAGPYNAELDVSFAAIEVSETAVAGKVWRRVVDAGERLIVHLINLFGQTDTLWDAQREVPVPQAGTLRVKRLKDRVPLVKVADPDGLGRLVAVPTAIDGDYAVIELPSFEIWQVVTIEL